MAFVHRSAVTLRFLGDNFDPGDISAALGVKATHSVRKGGTSLTPNGRQFIARKASWLLKVPDESPGDLDKQIAALMSMAPCMDFDICKDLSERFKGEIFAGVFLSGLNQGIGLLPETMLALGLRGLEIEFDIYSGRYEDDDHEGSEI